MPNKHCCYGTCKSDSRYPKDGLVFIRFPDPMKYPKLAKRWAFLCGRGSDFTVQDVTPYTYICNLHFEGSTDYQNVPGVEPMAARRMRISHKSCKAIGNVIGFAKKSEERDSLCSPPKKQRQARGTFDRSKLFNPLDSKYPNPDENTFPRCELNRETRPKTYQRAKKSNTSPLVRFDEIQGELGCSSAIDIDNNNERPMKSGKNEKQGVCETWLKEKPQLLLQIQALDHEKLTNHPNRVFDWLSAVPDRFHYYTGLKPQQFRIVCTFLGPALESLNKWGSAKPCTTSSATCKLSPKEELCLCLIKLRRGLTFTDMSHRFGVSVASLSIIFTTYIQLLYKKFGELRNEMFPPRERWRNELPEVFNNSLLRQTRCD